MTARQTITPALRQWIIDQAGTGIAAPSLVDAMGRAGWAEDVAVRAVEEVLRAHPGEAARAQGLPPAVPVPEPPLADSPLFIDAGDRRVEVLMAMANPRVVLFGNLLSPEECQAVIEAARTRMARSLTVQAASGSEEVNEDRTSDGMFFQRGENEAVARLEERIARLVRWPVENGEGLQVLHYRPGA
ncbi:MAG TPA: 2-oxoglutarate-dependent dioxygenase, partial [Alicycliphilus denitrificans]|nr:2-oxoglutarate-dependent dioxygenase [Alicycliphilus denitrificans]